MTDPIYCYRCNKEITWQIKWKAGAYFGNQFDYTLCEKCYLRAIKKTLKIRSLKKYFQWNLQLREKFTLFLYKKGYYDWKAWRIKKYRLWKKRIEFKILRLRYKLKHDSKWQRFRYRIKCSTLNPWTWIKRAEYSYIIKDMEGMWSEKEIERFQERVMKLYPEVIEIMYRRVE